jgi:hypothetical protein
MPNRLMIFGKNFLFIVRTILITLIHCVGRMLSLKLTGNTLHLLYKAQPVNAVWGISHYLLWEKYGHTITICGQNVEIVHHRKHITSPLQSPTKNAVWGNSRCLLSEKYGTHRYTMWAEYRDCTSQETYYVSTKKTNRLMLFGETFAVYCENHTEHTDTLCGQNVEFLHHRN